MSVTITSKNNSKTFDNENIINIGTLPTCHYKLDLNFEFIVSLQLSDNGKWQVVNNLKSDKVLFRGNPIGNGIIIGSLCKLMIAGTDEFISVKITEAGTNPKVVAGSLELANRKKSDMIRRQEPSQKTASMIRDEDLNEQDIESLYGTGAGVQAKLKIDKKKEDIETRRALIIKEIAYKANELRQKLERNELLLGVLNWFIFIVPFTIAYILKDIIVVVDNKTLPAKIMFLVSVGFIVLTMLLKLAIFLMLQRKNNKKPVNDSSQIIEKLSMYISCGLFIGILIFCLEEFVGHRFNFPILVTHMMVLCTVLCSFIGFFAGFTQNIIAEVGQSLDTYESREDFQAVIKDYQQWVSLYVNNMGRKKLKNIEEKIFNLKIKAVLEYLMGVLTAPFLAYGVSQTLGECFPEAAAWLHLGPGFKLSPIFLTLATLMICFAFHCFSVSFATNRKIAASNIIKQDGFSDYNIHGVVIHGVESTKNLKREAKKFFLIAIAVVFIELTMNISYFIGVMGGNVIGIVLSIISALVPTAILIAETNMLGSTKFDISLREELIEKVDKDY